MKGVSVVICSYNSESVIVPTLKHLSEQIVEPEICWEIVLVDNKCEDSTVSVATRFWEFTDTKVPLTVVKEDTGGLSYAREKGIRNARYEYVILCDDDNWLAKDYIQNVYSILESKPDISILGGQGIGVYEKEPPEWFADYLAGYAIGKQGKQSGYVSRTRGFLWGAGMGIRKKAWVQIKNKGFKSLLTDRNGKLLSAGGDSELCYIFDYFGFSLFYDESLNYQHYIKASRINWEYCKNLNIGLRGRLFIWICISI